MFSCHIYTEGILTWTRLTENNSENTISHNTDGERECHKLKFKGNFKNCLIKCANTVSKELIFHILDEHT